MRNMVARVKTLGKQWWHASFKIPLKRRCSPSFLRCACVCIYVYVCVWVTVCFKRHERFFGFWCHCFQDFSFFFFGGGGKDVSIILLTPPPQLCWVCELGPLPLWYSPVEINKIGKSFPGVYFWMFGFGDVYMPSCRWPRFHQNFFRTCFIMCPKPAWGRAQRAVVYSREDVPWETWA